MKKALGLLVASSFIVFSPLSQADEVIVNGGFETAGSNGAADSSNWIETFSGAPGSLSSRDATSPRTGGFAHRLVALGSDGIGSNSAISQSSIGDGGLPSLQGSTPLSATFNAKYNLGPGGVGFYVLRVLNGAGQIVSQTPLGVVTNGTGGVYQTFTVGPINVPAFGAAPNDVYSAFIELNVAAGAFVGASAEGFIDDVSINGTFVGGVPTGACCVANVCSIQTQAGCTGAYQGDGTSCASNPCNPPVTDEVAVNGGFETEGFGGQVDSFAWNEVASGAPGSLSERDLTMPRNGGFAHHLVALGGDAIGSNAAVFQNTSADGGQLSLQENTTLSASFSAKYTLGPGGVGFRVLRILNGAGQIVATTGLGVVTSGTGGVYQNYTMGPLTVPAFGAPPNDTYSAFIELNVAAGAFPGSSAEGFIDDVSIRGTLVSGSTCPWQGDGCYADYNNDGGIDGDDVIAFFGDWDTNNDCADADNSDGVDGDDVISFFASWDISGTGFPGC